ncbi:hypothetical protein AR158_C521L [Paramecium bursaria Chlorella virus AR158]|uniref:hypothetical protein n=1 Tax=Paramecium bursaria Chlorella virus AR158 TaxID=380598 RepID=UPI00015AA737|nr:hypothetical protein AR158_C521L [Paramecium bursaria Chlorella virus AR158]ABU44066.1 hypothetical protein AR158_C521L [Paramecium bursaria Chlorella virus AR158]
MLADFIKSIKMAVTDPSVKSALDDIIQPCMNYVDTKITSVTFFFQIIAILILVQCLATMFLIVMEIKRNM